MKTYIVFNLLYLFLMPLLDFLTGIYNQARYIGFRDCPPDAKRSRNDSLDEDMECYEAEVDISKSTPGKQNLGGFQNDLHT